VSLSSLGQSLAEWRERLVQAGRARAAARGGELSRLSSRVLAKGTTVHVIRWHGEDLLVGCTEHTMVVLARHDAERRVQDPR
jgi:flagellar biogenesis protein FliO